MPMRLQDLSSSIVAVIEPETSALVAAQLMRQHHIGALVVVDSTRKSHPIGIVTDRDLVLALIGRIVFFATWSVVTVLFPIVAQKHKKGEPHRHLLYLSLGLVMAVSGAIFAATLVIPELIVSVLFGQAYMSVAPLLWRYALATAVYALANVVITYRLSIGNEIGRASCRERV